jgi:hypothetical protein
MRANVGSVDRVVRFVLGLLLLLAVFMPVFGMAAHPLLQWGVGLVGVVLITTALMRFCPLYRLFGLSTCKVSR